MIKGITKSGFNYAVSKDRLNDYELVEQLAELEENPFILVKVIKGILGEEQTNKLKNHLRKENGTVPADKMEAAVTEILKAHTETKNS